MSKVLWLTSKAGIGTLTKSVLLAGLHKKDVSSSDITFVSLHNKVPSLGALDKKRMPFQHNAEAARHALFQYVRELTPRLIVVNDEVSLRLITERPYTLSTVRGSIYQFANTPVLILDRFENLWAQPHGKFVFGLDCDKLARFANGRQKNEPRFEFHVAHTVDDVRSHCERSKEANLLAMDTETRAGHITVLSITYDCGGKLVTFGVPFFDPWSDRGDGCYWTFDDERTVRVLLAGLLASPVPKTIQNGMYDCAYFAHEGMTPVNWLYDPSILTHSLWCEAPKKIHNIASYFLDTYQYWKDEAKGMREDNPGRNRSHLERYWQYNGLDSHYLWLSTKELVERIVQVPWAMRNYSSSFALSAGPCFASSLRGMKLSRERHASIIYQKSLKAKEGEADIRRMTGEPDFNLRSTRDVAWFLYDFLGARPTRIQRQTDDKTKTGRHRKKYGPRSTDEKVLKLIKEQRNPLINNFIDRLLRAKKPASDISKYGDYSELSMGGRFVTWLNPTGTTTGRFNAGSNQFWVGTNGQNIPGPMREMCVADQDYVFVSPDYSASDDRFIAYESQDPDKIATVEDKSKDIHCKHCAIFFSLDYDKIYKGWKNEEDWVVDEPKGVRQITKKIAHGRNYREGAETMFNLMGREACIATARALGYGKPEAMSDQQLIAVCGFLIDKYDHPSKGMYKRLRPWQNEIVVQAIKNGNTATFSGGFTRHFFGNIAEDHSVQRELSACYGQSGTAGNINRSLREIFYSGLDDGRTCLFLTQVHDNLVFLAHRDHIHRVVPQIKVIMERPAIIHGRSVVVPAEPKIGLTWSKYMMSYRPDLTYEQLQAYEREKFGSKFIAPPEIKTTEPTIDLSWLGSDIEDDDDNIRIPDGSGLDFDDETADEPELAAQ